MANQTKQLHELLRRDGVDVAVVATNFPMPNGVMRIRGVRAIIRLAAYVPKVWNLAARSDVLHVLSNSDWSWHLYTVPAIAIARVKRRAVIVNYRGGGAERFLARQWRLVVPMLRRATMLVVPSAFLGEVFARYGVEARLVANAVDTARFFPGQYAEISARREPLLITTRNLDPIYDVATAIRAFAIVRRALGGGLLVVAGDGPERARLEALARDLGIAGAVSFKGRLAPDDLAVLLRGANVLMNPSRVDNMPNSLLEALASGLPLVSTNVGGIPKIIDDGETGMLVAPGDADAMAAAALSILSDRDKAMRIAGAARNAARRFTWEVIGGQWRSLYERALQGG